MKTDNALYPHEVICTIVDHPVLMTFLVGVATFVVIFFGLTLVINNIDVRFPAAVGMSSLMVVWTAFCYLRGPPCI